MPRPLGYVVITVNVGEKKTEKTEKTDDEGGEDDTGEEDGEDDRGDGEGDEENETGEKKTGKNRKREEET